jgi:hypothetical protein
MTGTGKTSLFGEQFIKDFVTGRICANTNRKIGKNQNKK